MHGDMDDRAAAYAGGVAAPGHQRANDEVQTTARTGY